MNEEGYGYLRLPKKGLLSANDMKNRMRFCRKICKFKLGQDFWTRLISFYLDGKGFEYKTNPFDQAPKASEWRRKCEGLNIGCTSKGIKEAAINYNFMVGISYNHGVVLCEHYSEAINGENMAEIVYSSFNNAFEQSSDPKGRRFLQDGCPRQNSKAAGVAFDM